MSLHQFHQSPKPKCYPVTFYRILPDSGILPVSGTSLLPKYEIWGLTFVANYRNVPVSTIPETYYFLSVLRKLWLSNKSRALHMNSMVWTWHDSSKKQYVLLSLIKNLEVSLGRYMYSVYRETKLAEKLLGSILFKRPIVVVWKP